MSENITVNEDKQYIVVKLDEEQYGIDIKYIDNIVRMQNITRVPRTQSYFLGVINLRGEIIPVMSLRIKFGLPKVEVTNATRIIILKIDQHTKLGVLVDEVKEVVTLSETCIEKTSFDDDDANYLTGVGKYNNTLISLLNIAGILNDIENE